MVLHLELGANYSSKQSSVFSDIGWLWVLRLYASGTALLKGTTEGCYEHLEPILTKYGCISADAKDEPKPNFLTLIHKELAEVEKKRPCLSGNLATNLKRLGDKFRLNTIEREILAFRLVFRLHQGLKRTMVDSCVGDVWLESALFGALSAALKQSEMDVEHALHPQGRLCGSGLLTLSERLEYSFGDMLMILPGLNSALNRSFRTVDEMLGFVVNKAPRSNLSSKAFPYHADQITLIQGHIAQATKNRCKGVNILLHGKPGVGKTELARAIARELGMTAYEVATQTGISYDEESGWLHLRFRGYMLLQNMLRFRGNGLVIFDEIEDVIQKPKLSESPSVEGKAWLNELLENNPVPAIWISNEVRHLDPAVLRRFDIILEIRIPPRSKRKELLSRVFKDLAVDPRWIDKKAGESDLTPAITQRTLRVIRSSGIRSANDVECYFDNQMAERRNAQNIQIGDSYLEPQQYRLDWLNASGDMVTVADSLAKSGRGRVLLYGPPGCGKTAFAHYLSKQADRPLMLKRASDLMSMWLGETEKNLRDMFSEASRDEAVLLLDEADSFLQDRRGAQRSWELTQVNELLTRMENFQGVFICATNFMEHLDQAAMRRFTFRIRFDYLRPEQAENLMVETLKKLGSTAPDVFSGQKWRRDLARLTNLTPGDFSAAADHFSILGKSPTTIELMAELQQASEIKNGGKAFQMGFAA